jgi:hypothetical protein
MTTGPCFNPSLSANFMYWLNAFFETTLPTEQ